MPASSGTWRARTSTARPTPAFCSRSRTPRGSPTSAAMSFAVNPVNDAPEWSCGAVVPALQRRQDHQLRAECIDLRSGARGAQWRTGRLFVQRLHAAPQRRRRHRGRLRPRYHGRELLPPWQFAVDAGRPVWNLQLIHGQAACQLRGQRRDPDVGAGAGGAAAHHLYQHQPEPGGRDRLPLGIQRREFRRPGLRRRTERGRHHAGTVPAARTTRR